MSSTERPALASPLLGPPPGKVPCKPTLLLGVPNFVLNDLAHVLINDLVFSSESRYVSSSARDATNKLQALQHLDTKALLKMTKEHGGTVIHSEDDIWDQRTGAVDNKLLRTFATREYQAIVVDDTCFIREPVIARFVMDQYHNKGVSVVVMGVEGIFDISSLRSAFYVDWTLVAATNRRLELTEWGAQVIGASAFPFNQKYTKANFLAGQGALFRECVDSADYEDDSDYEDGPPPPSPGSPVVSAVVGMGHHRKSVSYFGFRNSLDVSFGAIVLRLCFAGLQNEMKV